MAVSTRYCILMQFRDHPIFVVHGIGSWWPPIWVSVRGDRAESLGGEIGVLIEAKIQAGLANRVFMRIVYNDEQYVGALVINDPILCSQLCTLMQEHVSRSVKEIGDLEVDHLL